jgi:hypothetical protein
MTLFASLTRHKGDFFGATSERSEQCRPKNTLVLIDTKNIEILRGYLTLTF